MAVVTFDPIVWPTHTLPVTVVDGQWTEFTLPISGDDLVVVNDLAVLVSFDPSLSDGLAVNKAAQRHETVGAGASPAYELGGTSRAEKFFVAGDGAAASIIATLSRGKQR
mgnify:CR=1 FL=1